MKKGFNESYDRIVDNDGSWDLEFWQTQGSDAIFEAAWQMILQHRLIKEGDDSEPRLQRSVEHFGKA